MNKKKLQEKKLVTKAAKMGVGRRLMAELESNIGRENLRSSLSEDERNELEEIEHFSNLFLNNNLGIEPGISQSELETGLENPSGTGFNNNFVFPVENGGNLEEEKAELYSNAGDFLGQNMDRFEGLYSKMVQNISQDSGYVDGDTVNINIDGDDIVDSIERDLRVELDHEYDDLVGDIGDEVESYVQSLQSDLDAVSNTVEDTNEVVHEIKDDMDSGNNVENTGGGNGYELGRREFLALGGTAGAGALIGSSTGGFWGGLFGGFFGSSGGDEDHNGAPQGDIPVGESLSYGEVDDYLSPAQERVLEENLVHEDDKDLEELEYEIEEDGDFHDVGVYEEGEMIFKLDDEVIKEYDN